MTRHLKFSLFFILLAATIACKKNETIDSTNPVVPKVQHFDKLLKFVSVTSGISTEELRFNPNAKEFYLPNSQFHISLIEAEENYAKANEYKAKYENN